MNTAVLTLLRANFSLSIFAKAPRVGADMSSTIAKLSKVSQVDLAKSLALTLACYRGTRMRLSSTPAPATFLERQQVRLLIGLDKLSKVTFLAESSSERLCTWGSRWCSFGQVDDTLCGAEHVLGVLKQYSCSAGAKQVLSVLRNCGHELFDGNCGHLLFDEPRYEQKHVSMHDLYLSSSGANCGNLGHDCRHSLGSPCYLSALRT